MGAEGIFERPRGSTRITLRQVAAGGTRVRVRASFVTLQAVMCRNIRVLRDFEPPTTPDEIAAAALQYVRKVSGTTRPSGADREAFDRAVAEVTEATSRLLDALPTGKTTRTREGEIAKAKVRWERRVTRSS